MPRKKPKHEEHENHERWLVSYADFITLLFAFFVVMYALSSINEGKYRVLADSIVEAFREVAPSSDKPIPMGKQYTEILQGRGQPIGQGAPRRPEEKAKAAERERMKKLASNVMEAMAPLVQKGQVRVTQSSKGISVEINASVLFSSAEAKLQPASIQSLAAVAQVLAKVDNPVKVEGHTDNLPIRSEYFPSNWELSSARAGSVVRLFVEQGVDPARLEAIGYADNRSVDTNNTPEGRARNRRVNILIINTGADEGEVIQKIEVQN